MWLCTAAKHSYVRGKTRVHHWDNITILNHDNTYLDDDDDNTY